jgi:hypothetical protein
MSAADASVTGSELLVTARGVLAEVAPEEGGGGGGGAGAGGDDDRI